MQGNHQEKEENHDKRVMLAKTELNAIEILISKALSDSCVSNKEFVSGNNLLKEYNEPKEEFKSPKNFCGIYKIDVVEISRKTYARIGIESLLMKKLMKEE